MEEDQTHEHLEHAEHAQHAAHSGNPFVTTVSVTIALLAVIAAVVGSLESLEEAATVGNRTQATLAQNQATDQWGFYQSKSLKKNMYEIAAANGGPNAPGFAETAKKNEADSKGIFDQAKKKEKEVEDMLLAAEGHEHRLHTLTFAATLLHVSIAIATMSIIMQGMRWPWIGSIGLGILGVLAALHSYY